MSQRIYRTFRGLIENGKINLEDPVRFDELVRKLDGKQIEVAIGPWHPKGTDAQRRYYFAVVCKIIGEYIGVAADEAHESLKSEFLKDISGPLPVIGSTKTLNTVEMTEYIERCVRWAAEQGVVIPDPHHVGYSD